MYGRVPDHVFEALEFLREHVQFELRRYAVGDMEGKGGEETYQLVGKNGVSFS